MCIRDSALSEQERAQIREVLNSEAFQDKSPREIYATLLEDVYKRQGDNSTAVKS